MRIVELTHSPVLGTVLGKRGMNDVAANRNIDVFLRISGENLLVSDVLLHPSVEQLIVSGCPVNVPNLSNNS